MPKTERNLLFLALLLLIPAYFINLGQVPLYLEEPRRALIALEMIFRGNWIVPTQTGELYFNKPPLYNWVLIGAYQLFGNYSEFATRFFSIIALLLMGLLTFLMGKKYVGFKTGIYSGLLVLVASDILFYFSVTSGEIDLFYSLLTAASFFALYHFYEQGQYFNSLTTFYGLNALGALTKGFPSLVFTGITLLAFVWLHKNYRLLLHWTHGAGILVFLLIVGGYYGIYGLHSPLTPFVEILWEQSSERTVIQHQVWGLISNLFAFPVLLIKIIAPASLLVMAIPFKKFKEAIRQNRFITYCVVIFLANIIVYWISPGTRSRYLYMFFPLMILVVTYAFFRFNGRDVNRKGYKILSWFVSLITGVGGLAALALPFISRLQDLQGIWMIALMGGVVLFGLLYFQIRQRQYTLICLIMTAIVLRWVFNFTVIPVRAETGGGSNFKAIGEKIVEKTEDHPLHLYKDTRISLTTVFYVERARREILRHEDVPEPQGYYIALKKDLGEKRRFEEMYYFEYEGEGYGLYKMIGNERPKPE